jgi:acetyl esterase/lipase/predicted alpha/beta-hydrolase family hydrolase
MKFHRTLARLTMILGMTSLMHAQQPRRPEGIMPPPQVPEGTKAMRDLSYVKDGHERHKLDLFVPEKADGPLPLLIWIHGGGWQNGSKEGCPPLRNGYTTRGYAVASLNYRLSGHAIFPAQIEDCKAAIRWLRAHANEYNLDPKRFGVWGSSAGGHLVALLGTSGDVKEFDIGADLDQSSRVQAVCDYFGPTDFTVFVTTPGYESHATDSSPEAKLIGGAVMQNKDKAARLNPITHVTKDDPPFLIVHGDNDRTVPLNQSSLLFEALKKAGASVQFHTIKGAGHGQGFGGPEIEPMVSAFFERNLKSSSPPAAPAAKTSESEASAGPPRGGRAPSQRVTPAKSADALPAAGLLYFASYPQRDNPAPVQNPHITGALFTIYWSDIEKREGTYDWESLDRRIAMWTDAGKKVALRIMWSSSGNWPEPAAKHPTPQFVLDAGAVTVHSESSKTDIPLAWDPIYRKQAERFLKEVARKFDGSPHVLFIDITPGAETNPYRFRRINVAEPDFKQRFMEKAASDGRKYSHELWLETVKQGVDDAVRLFNKTPLLVTLNVGSLDGPEQFQAIGAHCVSRGCLVGQNGLNARSYEGDSERKTAFQEWGAKARFYFETVDASGGGTGSLMEIMKAAERVGCDYLGVYAADVLRGTKGQPDYDPAFEEALAYGANAIGGITTSRSPARVQLVSAAPPVVAKSPVDITKHFKREGERWTYRDGDFEMNGILLKPEGKGPFPAVLISHGLGGAAESFGMNKAREMVQWGYVCIAPNYTHNARAAGPMLKGGAKRAPQPDFGASPENLRRAKTCLEILRSMPEVDAKRLCAYGHSMGGFVTIGLAASEPALLNAAAITGSGIAPREGFPAPSQAAAEKVRTPFLMLHGADDTVVRPEQSASLKQILDTNKVANDRLVADGQGHPIDQTMRDEVFKLVREWFSKHAGAAR